MAVEYVRNVQQGIGQYYLAGSHGRQGFLNENFSTVSLKIWRFVNFDLHVLLFTTA